MLTRCKSHVDVKEEEEQQGKEKEKEEEPVEKEDSTAALQNSSN